MGSSVYAVFLRPGHDSSGLEATGSSLMPALLGGELCSPFHELTSVAVLTYPVPEQPPLGPIAIHSHTLQGALAEPVSVPMAHDR